jgi:hypothetical protein
MTNVEVVIKYQTAGPVFVRASSLTYLNFVALLFFLFHCTSLKSLFLDD